MDEKTGSVEVRCKNNKMDTYCFGTYDFDLYNSIISQIAGICSQGNNLLDSNSSTMLANGALASIVEIDPQDSTELMLVTQMATVHHMAMEMSRRAMLADQTFEGREVNANRAVKLMRTYTTQVDALNKYRTKGQQKITVQHVNVNDGGQAVIGDVNQGGGND